MNHFTVKMLTAYESIYQSQMEQMLKDDGRDMQPSSKTPTVYETKMRGFSELTFDSPRIQTEYSTSSVTTILTHFNWPCGGPNADKVIGA